MAVYQDKILRDDYQRRLDAMSPTSSGQAAEKAATKGSSGSHYAYGMERRSDKVSTANKSILRFPSNLGTDPTQLNYMEFTLKEISAAKNISIDSTNDEKSKSRLTRNGGLY